MSHFLTVVLVPAETPHSALFDAVETLLAPFDENLDVDTYSVDCECCNGVAEQADPQCEDCQGTGKLLFTYNPDTQWDWWKINGRWDDNVLSARDLLISWESHANPTIPFAVVTPDGQWHQHAVNEVSADDWDQTVRTLLAAFPDALAVVCNLHI